MSFVLVTIAEIIGVLLVIYGLFHEKELIQFEDKIIHFIVKKYRRYKRMKGATK